MHALNRGLLWAAGWACALCLPVVALAQGAEPSASPGSRQGGAAESIQVRGIGSDPSRVTTTASAEFPDGPGAARAKSQGSSAAENSANSSPAQQSAQSSSATKEQKPQRPVGTAAAEAPRVSGITAAEPAGVAIAPAKQHRARAIVIKVGAIVGAGAALGAVIGLSEATHSKPPGAH
jgi:hypothetical protein